MIRRHLSRVSGRGRAIARVRAPAVLHGPQRGPAPLYPAEQHIRLIASAGNSCSCLVHREGKAVTSLPEATTRQDCLLAVDSLAVAIAMAHYLLFSYFELSESAWYQQKADILEVGHRQGWQKATRKFYHSKGVREVWCPARRHSYSAEFQAFPAGTVPADEIGSLKDIFNYPPRVA